MHCLALLILAAAPTVPPIYVDQFGWRPQEAKVAVFANPVKGQNVGAEFHPGKIFEVVNAADDRVAYSGRLIPWQDGMVSTLAGDIVWHADFSALKTPGAYYILDPKTGAKSYKFKIADDIYAPVLVDATRMFYYQRNGIEIPAKYGGEWTHPADSAGPGQDTAALFSQNGAAIGGPRNLIGGWYDAGDPNKYVPFLENTIFNLLYAYDRNPGAFGDANNIPESGNGVPDVLDEVKYELDWVLKMQDPDGGVHNRDGVRTYNMKPGPWSSDVQPRFYTSKTTWATAVATASFAHAARTFAPFDKTYPGYSEKLRTAALKGWAYLTAHQSMEPSNGQDGDKLAAAPGESNANADKRDRIYAAAELFRTTGEREYSDFVAHWAANVEATSENGMHPFKGNYVDPLNHIALSQALFIYCQSPNADQAVTTQFKTAIKNTAESIRNQTNGKDDPYLCYTLPDHYCWGSNSGKGSWARILIMAIDLNVAPDHNAEYQTIVEGYCHFIHGRNALGWCYLTNMSKDGASHSVIRPFHKWFGASLPDDANGVHPLPPPGYLVGGPNVAFTVKWVSPPYGEPAMKAYKDWDASWNAEKQATENSWEVTEPAIYYQAAYVLMLSSAMKG